VLTKFQESALIIRDLRSEMKRLQKHAQKHYLTLPPRYEELARLLPELERRAYALTLTPSDIVSIAREPGRPQGLDIVKRLIRDFMELHGDRQSGDDRAIIIGLGRLNGQRVGVIAQQKGHDAKELQLRHHGMGLPAGYRKAQRLMELADRFDLPILTFIDTKGARSWPEDEANGNSYAIAQSILTMLKCRVPIIASIVGEGGSGGALAIAAADRVLAFQYSYYSVIMPEGCANILWRDPKRWREAADNLQLTAQSALDQGIVDELITEPVGGAHAYPDQAVASLAEALTRHLNELKQISAEQLVQARRQRYGSQPGGFTNEGA